MIITALTEKSVMHNAMDVQLVQKWVAVLQTLVLETCRNWAKTYFGDGCGEHDNFIQLAHPLHELIDTRTLDNVYVVVLAFNLDRNGEVGLMKDLAKS
jgi:hypothetical protein